MNTSSTLPNKFQKSEISYYIHRRNYSWKKQSCSMVYSLTQYLPAEYSTSSSKTCLLCQRNMFIHFCREGVDRVGLIGNVNPRSSIL